MSNGWIVAFGLLWFCVLALAFVVVGILRSVIPLLYGAAAPPTSMHQARLSPLGNSDRVPKLSALMDDGTSFSSGLLIGQGWLLLLTSEACEPCRRLIGQMRSEMWGHGQPPLVIVTETAEDIPRMRGLRARYVLAAASGAELTHLYDKTPKPYLFAVAKDGHVRASGVINWVRDLDAYASTVGLDSPSSRPWPKTAMNRR
jgi:hypothetical protein